MTITLAFKKTPIFSLEIGEKSPKMIAYYSIAFLGKTPIFFAENWRLSPKIEW
jgi:hypothetical protein